MSSMAKELVREKMREETNPRRIAQLENKLKILAKYTHYTFDSLVSSAEWDYVGYTIHNEARELVDLRHSTAPNAKRRAELEGKFARYRGRIKMADEVLNGVINNRAHDEMHRAATLMAAERVKPQPDATRIAQLEKQFEKALSEASDAPKDQATRTKFAARFHEMAKGRQFNIALSDIQRAVYLGQEERAKELRRHRAEYARVHQRFASDIPNPLESSELRGLLDQAEKMGLPPEQRNQTIERLGGLMRWGDPLISISAPHDAQQVIALLPGGEVKRLMFNAKNQRWEARFDIPTHAPEGEFPISVIIVEKNGARRVVKLNFRVDGTAPQGRGNATFVDGTTPKLRLELQADTETARVAALLPWGAKIELKPSAQHEGRFFALASIPAEFAGKPLQITYVLTDRAHNRTLLTVDMSH